MVDRGLPFFETVKSQAKPSHAMKRVGERDDVEKSLFEVAAGFASSKTGSGHDRIITCPNRCIKIAFATLLHYGQIVQFY